MSISLGAMFDSPAETVPYNDFMGGSASMSSISRNMAAQGLDISTGTTDIYQPTSGQAVEHFTWEGVSWGFRADTRTAAVACGIIMCRSVGLTSVRSLRSCQAKARARIRKKSKKRKKRAGEGASAVTDGGLSGEIGFTRLTPLDEAPKRSRFWTLTRIELFLLMAGRTWWWYAGALGLIIASAVVPKEPVRVLLLAIAWAWPTMIWSLIGNREHHFQTESLVFPVARSVRRQLPATWIAGTIVAIVMGSGYGIRLLMAGRMEMFAALIVGAMFVSALALVSGVWTNSSRAFQIFYPVLCYLGLSGTFTWLDFKGVNSESVAAGTPLFFLLLTVMFLVLAMIGRRRQIERG